MEGVEEESLNWTSTCIDEIVLKLRSSKIEIHCQAHGHEEQEKIVEGKHFQKI